MKKIYIAGKITGEEFYKENFKAAEDHWKSKGYTVINPTVLPLGLEHGEYLHINFAMIDICDEVFFLENWKDSPGAIAEMWYAKGKNKAISYQEEEWPGIEIRSRDDLIDNLKKANTHLMIINEDIHELLWAAQTVTQQVLTELFKEELKAKESRDSEKGTRL